MRYASNFMLGLINDIFDMEKIESGAVTLTKEPYAYRDFVVNMRTMFQAQRNEKGIALSMPKMVVLWIFLCQRWTAIRQVRQSKV